MNVNETPEQLVARLEMQDLVAALVKRASALNLAVVGFVFGADPLLMIRFGNTKEQGPELAELYLRLSDIVEEKQMVGDVINTRIKP